MSGYKRLGECSHCGDCCAGCEYIEYIAVKDIKKGEHVEPVTHFVTRCKAYGKQPYFEKGCNTFPPHPVSTPWRCSYKWEEVAE